MCVSLETWMKLSPSERGIRSLTSAMTISALSAAGLVSPTSTPKVQKPCSSGGEQWIIATFGLSSSGSRSARGIWLRKIGVKSARPSFTAWRTLWLMKSELTRMCPAISGAT